MLNKLELKKLPFVDDCPEADQKRIRWVRNGELLTAASTKYGNDGVLNESGVGIFTDVLTLEDNANATKDSLNLVIDNVNNINEALEMGSDVDIIKQINTNKENIEILQVHMQFAESNIGELETDTEFLKEDVGVYDPSKDNTYRPIRNDLVFIKTEMGNYPDQDMNGNTEIGKASTGMKRRIIDNSSAIVNTIARVQKLEDDYQDSDVGSLSIKVNELREEVGPRTESIGKPAIYTRLTTLETGQAGLKVEMADVKTAINFGSGPTIATRMTNAETRLTGLETIVSAPITGLVPRVTANETAIGTAAQPASINGRLSTLRTDLDALSIVVGKDSSSGLRGQVTWLTQTMGTEINPAPTSVQGRLKVVETRSLASATAIQDIQTEIGNNNSGLKGAVNRHTRQLDGTNPNGSTVEERGVVLSCKQLETKVASQLPDAPSDGQEYVRKNAAWAVASAFSGAADVAQLKIDVAGLDSRVTAVELKASANANDITTLSTRVSNVETNIADLDDIRQNITALQQAVATKIDEAPSDGEAYVRKDGTWVLLSTFLTPTP